ncbi:MAG: ATP-binding protein [Deltaproteobacteria bacterium]|nr:ATP-binding protein [Deltaproteobacteria bacterium]
MSEQTPESVQATKDAATARRLERAKEEVLARWEERVRAEVPAAATRDSSALRNSLPDFLTELVALLSPATPDAAVHQAAALAVAHGRERAAIEEFSLDQVIAEYRVLRRVTLEVLEQSASLNPLEREVVLDAIHDATANSAAEFSRTRAAEREAFIATMVRANENLEARVRERTAQLVRNEQLFRGLVEGLRDYAIFTLDDGGHVTTWNTAAERMKGYTAAEIVGQHFSMLYPEEGRRRGEPMEHLRAAAREGRFRGEGVRTRKNGERYLADVLIVPMYEEGKLFGFSKVVQDLTERHSLLQELDLSRVDVERLLGEQTLRDNFIANISHDLRSPLQAVRTAAELIATSPEDPSRVRDWAERIHRVVTRLDVMVGDLLDASRAQAGVPLTLTIARCDLREIVEQSRDELEEQASHRVVVVVDGDTAGWWSPRDLRRIVDNLLSNAVKYGAPDQPITVTLRRVDDRLLLAVHNHGAMIAAEDQRKLFKQFHRTSSAASSGKPGWGLGLSLVRGLVEAHRGTVKVESYDIQGTTFTVDLPVDVRSASQPVGPRPPV